MIPLAQRKKAELVWMATHRCPHRHLFIEHPQCYQGQHERLGFLDIECSNLNADFGICLSWCILDGDSHKIYESVLTLRDIQKSRAGDEDKRVVQALIDLLPSFTRIVGWYSRKFDVPFIRTRAVMMGLNFPSFGAVKHTDAYYIARFRLRLSSNRLENACRALLGKTQKTRIENKFWRGAARGEQHSLRYVLDHNRKDVIDLERVYRKLFPHGRQTNTSL